jgi:hypothetical protein
MYFIYSTILFPLPFIFYEIAISVKNYAYFCISGNRDRRPANEHISTRVTRASKRACAAADRPTPPASPVAGPSGLQNGTSRFKLFSSFPKENVTSLHYISNKHQEAEHFHVVKNVLDSLWKLIYNCLITTFILDLL